MFRRRLLAAALLLLASSQAIAQQITPGQVGNYYLYVAQTVNGTLAGNTSATSEDPLGVCQYSIPAGTFKNNGDTVHIIVAWNFGPSTDTRTGSIRFNTIGGTVLTTVQSTVAAQSRGIGEVWVRRTAANQQLYNARWQLLNNGNAGGANNSQPMSNTETAAIPIVITGKSNPNSGGAGSVQCLDFAVDFMAGAS